MLPFYISSTTRPSPTLSRDAPSVIRGRIQSVTVSCIVCSVTTFVIIAAVDEHGNAVTSPLKALHKLGYFPIGFLDTSRAVALTAILFLGPLFEAGIVESGWKDWIRLRGLDAVISSWMGWRNMVAVSGGLSHTLRTIQLINVIGTNNGRNPLPLCICPPLPSLPNLEYHNHLPHAYNIRPSARSPFLRVPNHTSAYTSRRGYFAVSITVDIHNTIWRICYVRLSANRELIECYSRACILQLDGLSEILGKAERWKVCDRS